MQAKQTRRSVRDVLQFLIAIPEVKDAIKKDGSKIKLRFAADGRRTSKRIGTVMALFNILCENKATYEYQYTLALHNVSGSCLISFHRYCSDWKFLVLVYGLNGASSKYFSIWCYCCKDQINNLDVDDWPIQRKLSECTGLCQRSTTAARKGCTMPPLLNIPFEFVVVDTLHLFLRIIGLLFYQVVEVVANNDCPDVLTKEMERTQVQFKFYEEYNKLAEKKTKWRSLNGTLIKLRKVLEKLNIKKVMEAVGTEDAEGIDDLSKVMEQENRMMFARCHNLKRKCRGVILAKDYKENRKLEDLSPAKLDTYLSRFLLSVRKTSGEEYEPTTLRGFNASVERHLKKRGYSDSIITGQPFAKTRDALKSKQKELKRLGKGNKLREAASLDQEEIDLLFKKGVMGIHSPQALINTLWFNNCLHFGKRGGKEQRSLSWEDVVLKTDYHGKEYLEYLTERQTKTKPGDNPLNRRQIKPRTYENLSEPDERNPISAYKFYMTKRPKETLVDGSPFYLTIDNLSNEKLALSNAKWFKPQPMAVQIKYLDERLCEGSWSLDR
ncbi:hypothetical protein pdam_00021124 [Pocillopora damicornis]|uniref:ZMYM2-like/QRICH1 C-terminal domain-containing protein n=1 Tax=Pocillopora damicornis TaxID=46731 RepID=A0A3M6V464_POCDA|nr:hypothetical protein pdam_00021124 [Pocillopora damicornis]